jgi:hypothetical protein
MLGYAALPGRFRSREQGLEILELPEFPLA